MKNYAIPRVVNRQIRSLELIDNLLFAGREHDNFELTTDNEGLASYVKGKTGERASIIPIKSDNKNVDLWIVHSGECQSQHSWIIDESKYKKFLNRKNN